MFLMIQLVFNLVLLLVDGSAPKLSNEIPRCSMHDPKLGNCIVNVAEKLRKSIREGGIAEMGIPGYDPLVLPDFEVEQESDMVNFTMKLENTTIRGMENYDISEIQFYPETQTFKGKFELDPFSKTAGYDISGRLLFIPVRGKGNAHFAVGPINGTFEITGRIVERRNVEYYDFKEIDIKMDIDDVSLYAEGLFDGDEELGALINMLINRNSKVIIKAITPLYEKLSETFIARYFKWLTKKYPLYELFLH